MIAIGAAPGRPAPKEGPLERIGRTIGPPRSGFVARELPEGSALCLK
jgi:hypothetical protein